jgi:hypothetical protein
MPTPVSPVLSSCSGPEIKIAENQPEYQTLSAIIGEAPYYPVTTRWTFTPEERERIAAGGDIWLTLLTFGTPLQPIMIWPYEPTEEQCRKVEI